MKIAVTTIDEFLSEIRAEAEHLHQSIVRVRKDKDDVHRDGSLCDVTFWATCIVASSDTEYLLEYCGKCGKDEPGIDDYTGSDVASEWKDRISAVAAECGLSVRPGKIEIE